MLRRIKTDTLNAFNQIRNKDEGKVKIKEYEVHQSYHFIYLGLIIHQKLEIKEDVIHRIKVELSKQRNVISILYNRKITPKSQEKFYMIAIKLAMLYGIDCQVIEKQKVHKISMVETITLRQMQQ